MNDIEKVLKMSENALQVSENALQVSEKALEANQSTVEVNERLLKIELKKQEVEQNKKEDRRKSFESFPSVDDITYDKVTAFTETELKPWAYSLNTSKYPELVEGKKKMKDHKGNWREFKGLMLDGLLIGEVVTSDSERTTLSGICHNDKLYGTGK